jgi:hypothetical protein
MKQLPQTSVHDLTVHFTPKDYEHLNHTLPHLATTSVLWQRYLEHGQILHLLLSDPRVYPSLTQSGRCSTCYSVDFYSACTVFHALHACELAYVSLATTLSYTVARTLETLINQSQASILEKYPEITIEVLQRDVGPTRHFELTVKVLEAKIRINGSYLHATP